MKVFRNSIFVLFLFAACKQEADTRFVFKVDSLVKDAVLDSLHFSEFQFKTYVDGEVELDLKVPAQSADASFGLLVDSLRLSLVGNDGFHPKALWLNFSRSERSPYFFACGHTGPLFISNPDSTTQPCMEAPFRSCELTISRLPDSANSEPIYGWVKAETQTYYSIREPDKKFRSTFEGYFVAKRWDVSP